MAGDTIEIVMNLVDNVSKGLDNINAKMDGFRSKAQALSSALAPIGIAAAAGLGVSIKLAADYDKAMQAAARGMDLNKKEVAEFSKSIQGLAKDLNNQFSSTTLANIAASAGKLGIAKTDVNGFTESIAKMAVATSQTKNIEELGVNASKVAAVFKLNTTETEKYLAAVNKLDDSSTATSQEIVSFTKRVAGLAASAKLSATEMAAFGATMVSSGQAPNVAATFMNKYLQVLGSATTLSPKAKDALQKLGYEAKDLAVQFDKNASGTMVEFIKRVRELDTVSQREVLGRIFGQEHVDSAMLLVQQTDNLKKSLQQAGDTSGNLAKLNAEFEKFSKQSFEGQFNSFKNQVQEVGVQLGQALLPGLISVINALTPLLSGVVALVQKQPAVSTFIVTLLGIAAVSPVLVQVTVALATFRALWISTFAANIAAQISSVPIYINAISTALRLATLSGVAFATGWISSIPIIISGLGGVAASIGAATLAIAPWLVAIAAVAAAGYLIITNWGAVKTFFAGLWEGTKQAASGCWQSIQQTTTSALEATKQAANSGIQAIKSAWDGLKQSAVAVWESTKQTAVSAWEATKQAANSGIQATKSGFESLRSTAVNAWNNIKSTTTSAISAMSSAFSGIKSAFQSAMESCKAVLMSFINYVKNLGSSFASAATSWGSSLVDGFTKGVQSNISKAQSAVSSMTSAVGKYLPHSDAEKGALSTLTASGIALGTTLMSGLKSSGLDRFLGSYLPSSGIGLGVSGGVSLSPSSARGNLSLGGGSNSFNVSFNVSTSGSDGEAILKALKSKERQLLDFISQASTRINRSPY